MSKKFKWPSLTHREQHNQLSSHPPSCYLYRSPSANMRQHNKHNEYKQQQQNNVNDAIDMCVQCVAHVYELDATERSWAQTHTVREKTNMRHEQM